ncbi:MAG TPA: S41 family peptidase [Aquifex aeolicus]|uniref:S41 family peptidase n=1 Tax=Aquifex aeolicus TaxID=63363 RepID=A0A7C5L5U7_AQUAO|nr:S41 family peptidase [Aquifex aeolicus]
MSRFLLPLIAGAFFAGFMMGASGSVKDGEDEYSYLKLFTDVLKIVKENYVEEPRIKDLIYGALNGMVTSLDPFSAFFPPEKYKEFMEETEGEFGGVGIEISMEKGRPIVVAPIEGTPAYKAGLRAGDVIIAVDGEDTFGKTLLEIVKKIRGKPGTKVTLTIMRKGADKPVKVEITRAIIRIESVKYTKYEDLGYVKIIQFQHYTARDLRKALKDLIAQEVKGLIIDLRNNPGGLLSEAVKVSDLFLPEGKLIVYTKGRRDEEKYYAKEEPLVPSYIPVVILINKGSASASEIVTGALQDHGRATIVGEKSFGKASVQNIIPLEDNSALKLTVAYYYTPKGKLIHKEGITPDVKVEMDAKTWEKLSETVRKMRIESNGKKVILLPEIDVQLRKALEVLRAKLTQKEAA